MKMNNKMQSYNKQALSIAIILCVMVVLALFIPIQKTYAEYSDLSENNVVNFNQISNNVNVYKNGNASVAEGNYYYTNVSINNSFTFTSGHTYYFIGKINSGSSNISRMALYLNSYSQVFNITYTRTTGYFVLNQTSYNLFRVYATDTNNFACYYTLNVIDLNIMFGDDNIPTKAQCDEYFTAEYYNYTAGTPMPYSKGYLQGYQDGAKDILDSLHATYNNDILGTIAYPVNYGDIESNLSYESAYNRYIAYGICGLNFGDYITSTITYKGTYFIPNYDGGIYIVFFKQEGGIMTPIAVSEIVKNNNVDAEHYWSGSCNIQFNINNQDVLYFGFFTSYNTFNDSTATTMYSWSSELEVLTLNINAIIQSAIAKGQIDVKEQYEPGGIGYQSIYQSGYNEGLAQTNGFATALDLIATTFSKVGEILQIQILPGVPIGLFIVFPLLVGLIIFIVKMVKGG